MIFQKLHKWQTEQGVSDTALADAIGVHQSTISRAKRGLRVLDMEHQVAIQKQTKDAVLPADWAEFFALTTHLRPKKPKGGSRGKGAAPFDAPTSEAA